MIDRRTVLGAVTTPALATDARPPSDPKEVIRLWTGRPPGALASLPHETITDRTATSGFQDRFVVGIGEPLITVFRPARPNGAAALVIPGGGYIRVVIDKEGFEVAQRLAAAGITGFVLRYRLPAEGWEAPAMVALQDAQRAMRLIRSRSASLGVDPERVAAMGFSAGGHVAARLATQFDERTYPRIDAVDDASARPDLSALMYPVISMTAPVAHAGSRVALLGKSPTAKAERANSPQLHVTGQTPPTFMVHAWDDPAVPIDNTLQYLAALRAANVPREAHLFEEGGHGFGIHLARGKPAAAWPDLFLSWAKRKGLSA